MNQRPPEHQFAIEAHGLVKTYGAVRVLGGVDLAVPRGTVFALLGPNGAGKTTTVRILATLLRPDAGRASVAGFDICRDRHHVRRSISLTGQNVAIDELQTGEENLRMMARLTGLTGRQSRRRADEMLERFDLHGAARAPGGDLLRRHASAPRPGIGPRRAPVGDLSRRTDNGPRSAQPAGNVGGDRRAGQDRGERPVDHAVPGGGRPTRRHHRRRRRRTGGRNRNARRPQAADRRPATGSHPRRRRRLPAGRRSAGLPGDHRRPGQRVVSVPTDGAAAGIRRLLDEIDPGR